jgi:hypothetical protein
MSPLQILKMAGASALRRGPLGVDFRAPAAWNGLGRLFVSPLMVCSCSVHYCVELKHASTFCFFELLFFGKLVNI